MLLLRGSNYKGERLAKTFLYCLLSLSEDLILGLWFWGRISGQFLITSMLSLTSFLFIGSKTILLGDVGLLSILLLKNSFLLRFRVANIPSAILLEALGSFHDRLCCLALICWTLTFIYILLFVTNTVWRYIYYIFVPNLN